jgi:uncharacterized membrane protein YbaN (DUF454 family)
MSNSQEDIMSSDDVYTHHSSTKGSGRKVRRGFYFVGGTICLIVGAVGVVLPLVPTTPLLLLAAACYYKSSARMHQWLLNNRWFGSYLRNYAEGNGISVKAKTVTLFLLWLFISYSALFVVNNLIIQLVLFTIAVGVTIHLITLPTATESKRI